MIRSSMYRLIGKRKVHKLLVTIFGRFSTIDFGGLRVKVVIWVTVTVRAWVRIMVRVSTVLLSR